MGFLAKREGGIQIKVGNSIGLTKKYDSLLKKAENITQHLNNVLFAK